MKLRIDVEDVIKLIDKEIEYCKNDFSGLYSEVTDFNGGYMEGLEQAKRIIDKMANILDVELPYSNIKGEQS